jgi:hypothetical protein
VSRRPETIEEYAAFQVALTRRDRAVVLAEMGVDEDEVAAIDERFQDQLSDALDDEADGIPPLLVAYEAALRKAREDQPSEAVMSLEVFVEVTRALESGKDVTQIFERRGITLAEYLRGSEHWTSRLAADPELAARLAELLGR